MSCEDQKAGMVAHLYGELSGQEERRFREHLEACEACRVELGQLEQVKGALGEWREMEEPWLAGAASPAANPGIFTRLRVWWSNPAAVPRWAFGGAVAAALVLALVGSQLEVARDAGGIRVGWGNPPSSRQPAVTAPGSLAGMNDGVTGIPVSGSSTGRLEDWAGRGQVVREQNLLNAVEVMISQSEERQLIAFTRLIDYYTRQMEVARAEDVQTMRYGLGNLSGETRMELARTNQYLAAVAELLLRESGAGGASSAPARLEGPMGGVGAGDVEGEFPELLERR